MLEICHLLNISYTYMENLLEVKNLVTKFYTEDGVVHAVNNVSFSLYKGETLGIVGESGCGKSVNMLSILGLISSPPGKVETGQAFYQGEDLLQLKSSELRKIRGAKIGMIFKDPMSSLNPVLTIGLQLVEQMTTHLSVSDAQARERAIELLQRVGIPSAESRLKDYPHQFSGGMRQRVMIAMALSCSPNLLIADEPTTALDVTIQAQIIDLVKSLREEFDMSIIWITHNLGVVAGLANRVLVMYSGFIVEQAEIKDLFANPNHPYTRALLGAVPRLDQWETRLTNIEGLPPDGMIEPTKCPFAPRCTYTFERCLQENPELLIIENDHKVACWWDVKTEQPRYDI